MSCSILHYDNCMACLKTRSCWRVDAVEHVACILSGHVGAVLTHQKCPRRLESQASHLCTLVESDADVAFNLAILDVQHIPGHCRTRAVQHSMAAAQLDNKTEHLACVLSSQLCATADQKHSYACVPTAHYVLIHLFPFWQCHYVIFHHY